MRNFEDTFEAHMPSFVTAFLICMTVPLNSLIPYLVSKFWHVFFKYLAKNHAVEQDTF